VSVRVRVCCGARPFTQKKARVFLFFCSVNDAGEQFLASSLPSFLFSTPSSLFNHQLMGKARLLKLQLAALDHRNTTATTPAVQKKPKGQAQSKRVAARERRRAAAVEAAAAAAKDAAAARQPTVVRAGNLGYYSACLNGKAGATATAAACKVRWREHACEFPPPPPTTPTLVLTRLHITVHKHTGPRLHLLALIFRMRRTTPIPGGRHAAAAASTAAAPRPADSPARPALRTRPCPAAAAAAASPGAAGPDAAAAAAVYEAIRRSLAELSGGGQGGTGPPPTPPGAALVLDALSYHPPGAPGPLIDAASLALPPHAFGLVYGRSGAGKTTLLQLVAGLLTPTGGAVRVEREGAAPAPSAAAAPTLPPPRPPPPPAPPPPTIGLVFQFPERHFLGETLAEELTFGWPADPAARAGRGVAAQAALAALSLAGLPLATRLRSLSDGYKRRVALAVQLARAPDVLLLDEPLAGLDWAARRDIVAALRAAKQRATVLVVSHDLAELAPLVDAAWVMQPGGVLREARWPPTGGGGGE